MPVGAPGLELGMAVRQRVGDVSEEQQVSNNHLTTEPSLQAPFYFLNKEANTRYSVKLMNAQADDGPWS